MSLYYLRLIKQIHANFSGGSSEDVMLVRDVELPFVPWEGLLISGKCDPALTDTESWEECVESLTYSLDSGEFHSYVSSDETLYIACRDAMRNRESRYDGGREAALKIARDEYVPLGWRISNWPKEAL